MCFLLLTIGSGKFHIGVLKISCDNSEGRFVSRVLFLSPPRQTMGGSVLAEVSDGGSFI